MTYSQRSVTRYGRAAQALRDLAHLRLFPLRCRQAFGRECAHYCNALQMSNLSSYSWMSSSPSDERTVQHDAPAP